MQFLDVTKQFTNRTPFHYNTPRYSATYEAALRIVQICITTIVNAGHMS